MLAAVQVVSRAFKFQYALLQGLFDGLAQLFKFHNACSSSIAMHAQLSIEEILTAQKTRGDQTI